MKIILSLRRCYCAARVGGGVGCAGYVTMINEPVGSGYRLSDKIMTIWITTVEFVQAD